MVVAKAKSARSKSPSKEKKDLKPKEAKRHKPESRVDRGLITKAVAALIKHNNDQSSKKEQDGSKLSLLGNDRPIQVQFGLEIPPQNASLKPIRILIPNPIVQVHHEEDKAGDDEGLEEPSVCLIVKDSAKASVKEFIEKFSEHMGCVKKVLTLDSLRKKHSRFQQRRELLQKYDIFMADDRILPMLTAALGKDFVKAKKLPLPICITRKEALPFAIQKNLSATYMTVSRGTSITVKAGNTGMPEDKLVENILAIAEHAVDKIPRKWANIRNIAVKTPESTSLPFYNKLPEELLEIAKSAGLAPTFKDTKKEDDTGEKNDNDDSKKDESKKKRELVGKSPLIRALKKQKKESSEKIEATTEKSKSDKKKTKTEISVQENKKAATKDAVVEESILKNQKTEEKKRRKEKAEEPPTKKEAKKKIEKENPEYVASKKFKGSKTGYVFRAGKQGVGYYKDVKPVVDKMVLSALIRAGSQGNGGRGRSKSAGKRKGRR